MIRIKNIIFSVITAVSLMVGTVCAADGYTLMDSSDVVGSAGTAFVLIAFGAVAFVAMFIIKILLDR